MPPQSTSYLLELWLASGASGELVGRALRPLGVEPQLFGLLTHIAHREPVPPSVISAEEGIPVTTIRDNVQRLVDRGLVERVPNPDDGRSYLLARTASGADVLMLGNAALAGVYEALDTRLPRPAQEYEAVLHELRDAVAAVSADGVRATIDAARTL
jgi:DNA-binding MarR family transcriptional regulator